MFKRQNPRMRKLRFRRPQLERPAVNRIIPNMLTVAALCAGMTAIRFALAGEWRNAALSVIVAAVLDGLDGRIARLLNATSKFGAELDSLADFISFGVAPAMLMYIWTMNQLGGLGWAVCLLFAVCMALRLARFNTALGDPNPPPWAKNYFTGVPAPAAALLGLLPLIATFEFGPGLFDRPWFNFITLALVAGLMVSRIPTFSMKKVHLPPSMMMPALIAAALLAAALTSAPWLTALVLGVVYLGSIPFAVVTQRRARASAAMMPMPMPSLPAGGDVQHAEERK